VPAAHPPEFDDRLVRGDNRCDIAFTHRVRFTRGLFDPANPTLVDAIDPNRTGGSTPRLLLALDAGLAAARPGLAEEFAAYARAHAARMPSSAATLLIPGGEACKNDPSVVDALLEAVERERICRRSAIVAVGGGAVLDVVGFAAAIAHRGVRLVRVPTTTLAQDDAAMGVKNGVNRFGKKNFVGAFAVPWAVLCDETLLETLPDAHYRDGFSEAVKIALLRDPALFAALEAGADAIRRRDAAVAMPIVRRSAHLHLKHILEGGDPFESREARPLDYGHWSAHRLESLTRFELSHGAAVGVGVALDTAYAAIEGRLPERDAERTLRLLHALGIATWHPALAEVETLLAGLEEFREHLGGRLTITLLEGIGRPVDVHALDRDTLRRAIDRLAASSTMRP
jgi:3-dehydroquinate synthase